jgi:hypothetical protein
VKLTGPPLKTKQGVLKSVPCFAQEHFLKVS